MRRLATATALQPNIRHPTLHPEPEGVPANLNITNTHVHPIFYTAFIYQHFYTSPKQIDTTTNLHLIPGFGPLV
jgi:hypothetical protein